MDVIYSANIDAKINLLIEIMIQNFDLIYPRIITLICCLISGYLSTFMLINQPKSSDMHDKK